MRYAEPLRPLSRFFSSVVVASILSLVAAQAAADVPAVDVPDVPGPEAPAGDAGASAPAPPPAPSAPPQEKPEPETPAKSSGQLWPSLVLEPGAGVVVAPRVLGAGMFGFSAGVVYLTSKHRGDDEVHWLLASHVGYTFAPRANRAELTLTAGRSLAGYFVLALRGGPTVDTDGNFGFRAGVRGSALHLVGLELLVHHGFVAGAPETSLLAAFSIDLVPAAGVFLLAQALGAIFK